MLLLASLSVTELAPLDDVSPVPPFATAKVPATVIAPEVALLGVNPVVPPLKVETPVLAPAAQTAVPPLTVRT